MAESKVETMVESMVVPTADQMAASSAGVRVVHSADCLVVKMELKSVELSEVQMAECLVEQMAVL